MIKKQRLFKQAFDNFADNKERLDRVNWIFAEYLDQRGYIDEAGYAYLKAGDLEQSMEAFSKGLNIEMVFSIAA
jgi:tetratricopeptide (TPR) repeat protein